MGEGFRSHGFGEIDSRGKRSGLVGIGEIYAAGADSQSDVTCRKLVHGRIHVDQQLLSAHPKVTLSRIAGLKGRGNQIHLQCGNETSHEQVSGLRKYLVWGINLLADPIAHNGNPIRHGQGPFCSSDVGLQHLCGGDNGLPQSDTAIVRRHLTMS